MHSPNSTVFLTLWVHAPHALLAVIYTGRNPWEFRIDWREFSSLILAREFEWDGKYSHFSYFAADFIIFLAPKSRL